MIAFDFDGVICDVYHIFRGHFFHKFGVIMNREFEHDKFEFNLDDNPEYENWWWKEIPVAITKYQHLCPPYVGAIEAMDAIRVAFDLPYIQIITAREPSDAVMQVTHLWCHQNFIFPYQIDFCATSEEKADIMAMHDVEYYVDDRFKTAMALAPILRQSYLLNSPWNQRDDLLLPNVERVDNLWQMKNRIEKFRAGLAKTD